MTERTDTERLEWLIKHSHLRVQGSDQNGWSVLDMRKGLTFVVRAMPTSRNAIDAAMEIRP